MLTFLIRRLIALLLSLLLVMFLVWLLVNYAFDCPIYLRAFSEALCLRPAPLPWIEVIVILVFVVAMILLIGQFTPRRKYPLQEERL